MLFGVENLSKRTAVLLGGGVEQLCIYFYIMNHTKKSGIGARASAQSELKCFVVPVTNISGLSELTFL